MRASQDQAAHGNKTKEAGIARCIAHLQVLARLLVVGLQREH